MTIVTYFMPNSILPKIYDFDFSLEGLVVHILLP